MFFRAILVLYKVFDRYVITECREMLFLAKLRCSDMFGRIIPVQDLV